MDKKTVQQKVKVLYQNLGGIWYAFAQNGEEIYFGRVPVKASAEETLAHLKAQQAGATVADETASAAQRRNRRPAAKNAA